MDKDEKVTIDTFSMIMDCIIKGEQAKYDDIRQKFHDLFEQGEDLYESQIALLNLNITECEAAPFRKKTLLDKDKKHLAIIPYLYNGVFEHYVRTFIENAEGWACSADKTNFIISGVKKSLIEGTNLSLEQYYDGDMEEYKGRLEYWSPASFQTTYQVMDAFYEWYYKIGTINED